MKKLITTAVLWLALTVPAAADKISLDALSAYLNDLQTAKAPFTQINGDETISTGTVYIKRPGRVRFEYNAPDRALVMAGGGQVAIFDRRSNSGPEQYPLKRTPLNLILERNVNLSKARMVVNHTSDGPTTTVTAQDPENPEYGSIELVFTADPVELRQWVINDDGGGRTTVILGNLTKGVDLAAGLFSIPNATANWP